jgi:hypothetical protein
VWLHRLPDNVSWTGRARGPFSCGYYAAVRADNLDASDTAMVLGAGPIGLGVVAAASVREPASSWPSRRPREPTRPARRRRGGRPDNDTFLDGSTRSPTALARRWSSRRAESWPRWRAGGCRLRCPARLHRNRRRWFGPGEIGPVPVEGAAGARHHQVAWRVAQTLRFLSCRSTCLCW